ncbi:invasion associated locus B family protein [Aliiroseovarius sp. PTFE2010]|uniref:invasion associated locus B family protein n=1 Tax=Aliiroseovarius sp. PTFE2010 TaxID=3417190 RepID=UPI003CF01D27
MHTFISRITAASMIALLATAATAQETDVPGAQPAEEQSEGAIADGLALGEEVTDESQVGQSYIVEEHGDWTVNCVHAPEGQKDPCNLYQLLKNDAGNDVAEISLFPLPASGQAVAGATIITPLETMLTEQVVLQVDSGKAKRYPFSFCTQIGCFARVGLTAEDISAFKRGKAATLAIVPVAAPDQKVQLKISLTGFTAGYEAVGKANAAE